MLREASAHQQIFQTGIIIIPMKEVTMSVKVIDKQTGEETVGKFALVKGDQVNLYTGIMSDKKGGWRGCGKRIIFPTESVTITADDPTKELKQQD